MSAIFRRDQYSDLYGTSMLPVLEEIFRSELAQAEMKRDQIFKTVSTERDIWQYTEMHDLEKFKEVPEGTDYDFVRPKQGSDKTLKPKKFGLGVSITREAIDDGKFDEVSMMLRHLSRSAKETQEVSAMNIINNGFSTETTADGVSLFNATHSLPSGGSYRNRLSTDADLSVTSLDAMLSDFETEFVSDGGIILAPRPSKLLVHPTKMRLAKELIGSDLKPETADNNMNSFKEDGLRVVTSPHLTDEDAWYLIQDNGSMNHGLVIVNRQGIRTEAAGPDVGFNNDSMHWKASYREKVGATNGYGIFGSAGTGA